MTNVDINSGTINGITDLAITDGGTGASTAAGAAENLGLGITDNVVFSAISGSTGEFTSNITGSGNLGADGDLYVGGRITGSSGATFTDKVGIGTNAPIGGGLDILGDEEALVVRTADSGRVGIVLKNQHTGTDVNFTDGLILKLDSDESGFIGLGADNPSKLLNLGAANTTVMTISGSGQVGIGTDDPRNSLELTKSKSPIIDELKLANLITPTRCC